MTRLRPTLRARHAPDGTLPLINIVLLLVLAFMIAGTIAEPLPAGFTPVSADGRAADTSARTPLMLAVDAGGRVLEGGQALETEAVQARLEQAVAQGQALSVRADARTRAKRVIALISQAEAAGIGTVTLITVGSRP